MEGHLDARGLGNRDYGFEELGVILPELCLGVPAVELLGKGIKVAVLREVKYGGFGASAHLNGRGALRHDPHGFYW